MLSKELLNDLLQTAILGDGHVNAINKDGSYSWCYDTISPKLAADIHEIALKAGYRASTSIEKRAGTTTYINAQKVNVNYDMNRVYIYKSNNLWYPIPIEQNYSGNQVCVFVKDHHNIMIRRNGKSIWAGNCWPPVSEMWFYYLSKDWRDKEAPHTDAKITGNNELYDCNFSCSWGYSLHPALQTRHQDYQNFALGNFKEAAQDIISTWVKV